MKSFAKLLAFNPELLARNQRTPSGRARGCEEQRGDVDSISRRPAVFDQVLRSISSAAVNTLIRLDKRSPESSSDHAGNNGVALLVETRLA
ncbi:MAG TPA: hypothetical protein VIY69_17465 [Candidatus Acidoferrales bacterium]